MKCRCCLEKLNNDNTEPEDDSESSTPEATVFLIGDEYPTVLCLDCFDIAYIKFKDLREAFENLDTQLCFTKDKLDGPELIELIRKTTEASTKWNTALVKWIRKGKDE